MAFSHLIPPVQYVAIFLFNKNDLFFLNQFGKSEKFFILGKIALLKWPISCSYSFLVSNKMMLLSSIKSSQSFGLMYLPVNLPGSKFSSPSLTISFFIFTLSFKKGRKEF